MNNENKTWVIEGIYGVILPSYVGIIPNHCKDPFYTTSIMESKMVFFVAHMYISI